MTRRERLERKLDKREEWRELADKRSSQNFDAARDVVKHIPPGQPIMVGHHSEKRHRRALARMDAKMRKGWEQKNLAKHHAGKADGLARQLGKTIFSDDTDAITAIESRIAERDRERDRWKLYNASCRTGKPDPTVLDDTQKTDLSAIIHHAAWQMGKKGQVPGYVLANLSGNIRSDRERVKKIQARNVRLDRATAAGGVLIAKTDDYCSVTFAEKPALGIRRALKAAGFGWSGGSWNGLTADLPSEVSTKPAKPMKPVDEDDPAVPVGDICPYCGEVVQNDEYRSCWCGP